MSKRQDVRGFTMMEMVVVLAVIAILAAILTPIINSYVERARLSTARSDVKNLAAAIVQFNSDTKFWPIYTGAAQIPNGTVFGWMATDGQDAALPASWTAVALGTTTGSLTTYLNTNFYTQATSGGAGAPVFRGPYLELGPDAWGSRYYVTSGNLKPGDTEAAYVISPGPDQTIQTVYGQVRTDAFTVGGDDILARIR